MIVVADSGCVHHPAKVLFYKRIWYRSHNMDLNLGTHLGMALRGDIYRDGPLLYRPIQSMSGKAVPSGDLSGRPSPIIRRILGPFMNCAMFP